jgi:hypothetical protein
MNMYSMLKSVFFCLAAFSCAVSFAQDYEPGKVIPEIKCKRASDYSYILYLPKSYDPAREEKWPVLFIMGPNGGRTAELQRYVPGAELCGWILAMSVQSKNGSDEVGPQNAILAMTEDVFDRFSADKKRCYASGFSGGAREAFWLASRLPDSIIGIIPCGAGGNVNSRVLAYGLSGAACFNRWDMTITFKQRVKERGQLRFFPGQHKWADAPYIQEAMLWMNGQYLKRDGEDSERTAFSNLLLAQAKENKETKPAYAYEVCKILSEMKKAPDVAEAKDLLEELEENPDVKTHVKAQEDIEAFSGKYFNTNVMDYLNKPTTPASEKEAQKLAEKYKDTPYEELMKGLGQQPPTLKK